MAKRKTETKRGILDHRRNPEENLVNNKLDIYNIVLQRGATPGPL